MIVLIELTFFGGLQVRVLLVLVLQVRFLQVYVLLVQVLQVHVLQVGVLQVLVLLVQSSPVYDIHYAKPQLTFLYRCTLICFATYKIPFTLLITLLSVDESVQILH